MDMQDILGDKWDEDELDKVAVEDGFNDVRDEEEKPARFAKLQSEVVDHINRQRVAETTMKKTKWAVNVFQSELN